MQAHRHTVELHLRMSENPALFRVPNDKSLRVMVFCSAEPSGRQDVSFPHQSEIKVNGGEAKANLRGLKNKPGSTRPVDITNLLRLQHNIPNYENKIAMTYALTNKASDKSQSQSKSEVSAKDPPSLCLYYLACPLLFRSVYIKKEKC